MIDRDGLLVKLLPTWFDIHHDCPIDPIQTALLGRPLDGMNASELSGRVAARELLPFVEGFCMEVKRADEERDLKAKRTGRTT